MKRTSLVLDSATDAQGHEEHKIVRAAAGDDVLSDDSDFAPLCGGRKPMQQASSGSGGTGSTRQPDQPPVPKGRNSKAPKGKAKAKPEAANKGKTVKGTPDAKKLKKPSHMTSQNKKRELQKADRHLAAKETLLKHFNEDILTNYTSEASQLDKKFEALLSDTNRWIYLGEDFTEADPENEADMQIRVARYTALKVAAKEVSSIAAVSRCSHATDKDTENYDIVTFRHALEDMAEARLHIVKKYIYIYTYTTYICISNIG